MTVVEWSLWEYLVSSVLWFVLGLVIRGVCHEHEHLQRPIFDDDDFEDLPPRLTR